MSETIRIGMAQLAVAKSPHILETQALGSCVGIVLYEPHSKIGGISHAMLPDIADAKESSRDNLYKFANTAIQELLNRMVKEGANRKHISARITGGANMFPDIAKQQVMHIGRRNTDADKKKLEELEISITAEDTGGSYGRTIRLDTHTGKLYVKTIMQGEKEI